MVWNGQRDTGRVLSADTIDYVTASERATGNVSGDRNRIDWSNGSYWIKDGGDVVHRPPQQPLSVSVSPAQHTMQAGEPVTTIARVTGGAFPYRYQWFDGANLSRVTANEVRWSPGSPGTHVYQVVVTDAAGQQAEAQSQQREVLHAVEECFSHEFLRRVAVRAGFRVVLRFHLSGKRADYLRRLSPGKHHRMYVRAGPIREHRLVSAQCCHHREKKWHRNLRWRRAVPPTGAVKASDVGFAVSDERD